MLLMLLFLPETEVLKIERLLIHTIIRSEYVDFSVHAGITSAKEIQ